MANFELNLSNASSVYIYIYAHIFLNMSCHLGIWKRYNKEIVIYTSEAMHYMTNSPLHLADLKHGQWWGDTHNFVLTSNWKEEKQS